LIYGCILFDSFHSVFLKPQTRRCWTSWSVNTKGTPTLNFQQSWSRLSSSNTTRAKWSMEWRSVTQLFASSCFHWNYLAVMGKGSSKGSTEMFWREFG